MRKIKLIAYSQWSKAAALRFEAATNYKLLAISSEGARS